MSRIRHVEWHLYDALAESARKRKEMKEKKAMKGGGKTVLHAYSLEEYGLSEEIVLAKFDAYISKCNL